ncbi:MAG: HipA domain-containing protein [Clostridia bacterium]|nr:HipA domain-containing protein [Clostridia bacterium]
MGNKIDFTSCKRIIGRAYNGANGKKIAVEYEGERYMLKFPPSGNKKPTELSYTNSSISEHIASSIFNMIGINAQETLLGTFNVNGKVKIVCACKDFTDKNKNLYDFCSIKNTVIDSEHNGTGTELADVLETIEKQQFVNPKELLEHFWNVFVIDALLGNFDRHNGNWGFLFNEETQTSEIAPVFDCGSCLLPQADGKIMKAVLENEDELNARVFQFPTSAIKLNDKKINYYDFISSTENIDCNNAILRILPKVDIEKINSFIDDTPYISDLQKDFYKTYINARYEKILLPIYKN